MATYRNKQDDTIPDGSEFKLNVNMEPIDGYHIGRGLLLHIQVVRSCREPHKE